MFPAENESVTFGGGSKPIGPPNNVPTDSCHLYTSFNTP